MSQYPGCYGEPIAISASSPSCCICPWQQGCLSEAEKLLGEMPDTPEIKRERQSFAVTWIAFTSVPAVTDRGNPQRTVVASSRGLKRIVLSKEQSSLVACLPKRIATQARQLMERGWFDYAKSELSQQRNPANKGWKKVFCEELMNRRATRKSLEVALSSQLALTPHSARVQTSVGIAIFAAGRLATEQFDRIVLNPVCSRNNAATIETSQESEP